MAEEVFDQEIETPAATEEVTNATESATEEQQEPQEGEQKPDRVQKRIDRAVKAQREAERKAEYWRQEALKAPASQAQEQVTKAEGKPSENDFETHADFVEALADWKIEQKLAASKQSEAAERVKQQQQTVEQGHIERVRAFAAKTPDYVETMEDAEDLRVSDAVIEEIKSNEHGPELLYFLAKNPAEAARLSALGPLALAREVGKIESRFTSSPSEKTVNVTKAPAPITPVGKATRTSLSLEDAPTYAEFEARRNAQLAAR